MVASQALYSVAAMGKHINFVGAATSPQQRAPATSQPARPAPDRGWGVGGFFTPTREMCLRIQRD